ncbi:beta-microseminoprotein-like [Sarcophilus harrisii]|uniref:Beta-microseminoprotein n=1 Tax=Sarcophilus harrisii TaxID=9305 RepID=G3WS55_SARHA|nr:beta-microseminoprotein-like [Sarcophilus harrisii]
MGDTSCFQLDFPPSAKGCFMDDDYYANGKKWRTKDCQDCRCYEKHMTCCLSYLIPIIFDRENCVDIFDLKTCSVHIVKKANPGKKCEIMSASG